MEIALNGPSTVVICIGEEFKDPGAHAEDDNGVPLEVSVAGFVESAHQSTHTLVYSATDDAANFACVARTVVVTKDC